MIKTLYGRLVLAMIGLFCGVAALSIWVIGMILQPGPMASMVTKFVVGTLAFALLAELVVFAALTRRLSDLAAAVDKFSGSDFSAPANLPPASPKGDEVGRLGFIFEQMQRRLIEQFQRLQKTDELRRELLANVSHDLRTPLASVRGYLETLLLKEGSLSREEQRNYLEVAAKQAERLTKLVADLFELAKLDAKDVPLNLEIFSIAELVQDVAQGFQHAASQKGVRIESHFPESVSVVRADISMIQRVLENLIENAVRHCSSGAVVRVDLSQVGDRLMVQVSDTGSGIASEDLPSVFDRFYQAGRNQRTNSGAGLGLAITKRILDLHGAQIKAESKVGAGTTFRFDLPVAGYAAEQTA